MPGGRSRAELERAQKAREKKSKRVVVRRATPDSYVTPAEKKAIAREQRKNRDRQVRGTVLPTPLPTGEYRAPVPRAAPRRKPVRQPGPSTPKRGKGVAPIQQYKPVLEWAMDIDLDEDRKRAYRKLSRDKAVTAAARRRRRRWVSSIPKDARDFLGKDRINDFIREGAPLERPGLDDIPKAVGAAAGRGVQSRLHDYLTGLVAPEARRRRGPIPQGVYEASQAAGLPALPGRALYGGVEHGIVGTELSKLLAGEDVNPALLGVDAVALMVPIKGLPTATTVLLRGIVGATRLRKAERAGKTVAEVLAEVVQTPVMSTRAARRARLRSEDAPRASSWGAKVLSGKRKGAVATFIRNDPTTRRTIKQGGSEVETVADLSRTFKFIVRPFLDKTRPVTGYIPGITSQRKLWGRQLMRKIESDAQKYVGLRAEAEKALPDVLDTAGWAGVYAARAVLKGNPIDEMIQTTADNLKAALAEGRKLDAARLRKHLAFFKAAEQYVTKDAHGNVVFTDDSPVTLEDLRAAITNVSTTREGLLKKFDKLSEQAMDMRVTKEQLLYHGAKLKTGEVHADAAFADHPIRQQIGEEAVKKFGDEEADFLTTVLDAKARQVYEELQARHIASAEHLEGSVREAPDMDPELAEDWMRRARKHRSAVHTMSPAVFYDHIHNFADELPEEIIAAVSLRRGEFEKDWLFSIREQVNPFHYSDEKVAENLARHKESGDLTWVNPRTEDENGIPVMGETTEEDVIRRILLATEDPEQRAYDADFYHLLDEVLGYILTKDEEIVAWLSSQKGASPSRGVRDLLKVQKAILEGREIPLKGEGSIGLAAKAMEAILQGETGLTSGAAAKLSDFIDSALLKETRTWLGDEPGIAPIVVDRWGARSWGIIDRGKTADSGGVSLVKSRFGVEAQGDMRGGVSAVQYEQILKKYASLTAKMNEMNFDGRSDWTGLEIQAMDWAAIQRYWGEEPEDLYRALDANIYRADFEITQGAQNLGADLPVEDVQRVALSLEPMMRAFAQRHPGVRVGNIHVDTSGWAEGNNASVHMELLGLEEDVQPVITKIAQAFDQGLVQASRYVTVNEGPYQSKAALIIESDELADSAVKAEFFTRLNQLHPELGGHMPTQFARPKSKPGIVIRTTRGNLTKEGKAEWAAKYNEAVQQVAKDMGIAVDKPRADNLQLLIGSQHGAATPEDTTEAVGGIRALRDLPRDSASLRRELKRRLEAARLGAFHFTEEEAVDVARLEADEARVDAALKELVDQEYHGNKVDYDLSGGLTRGKSPARAVPKDVPMPRMRGGRVDIQRAGELARPVESTGLEYTGRAQSGREIAEMNVLNRLRQSADPADQELVRAMDDAAERRFAADRAAEPAWLHEQTAKGRIMGMWDAIGKGLYVSKQGHPMDWFHETMHAVVTEGLLPPKLRAELYVYVGADPNATKLTREQSEDLMDMFEAMIIGFDAEKSKLPVRLKKAIMGMKTSAWNSTRGFTDSKEALKHLPEELRLRMEDVLFVRDNGLKFRGARATFEMRPGVYTPEVRGEPFGWVSANSPRRVATNWARMVNGQKISSLTPTDKHIEESFTGALIETGHYEKDVTLGPLEGLYKAVEIEKFSALRQWAIDASTPTPTYEDDLMIPLDPHNWTAEMREQAEDVFAVLDKISAGAKVNAKELEKIEAVGIEHAKDIYFPGMTEASKQAIKDIAKVTKTPIEGVVWVRRSLLMETGMFDKPAFRYSMGAKGSMALDSLDFINNIAKMLTLSLNPAYYPMNMAGQAVMLGAQQGFMAPVTLARSLVAWRSYTDAQLAVIDHAAGLGVSSVVKSKGGFGSTVTDGVGKATDLLIDRYPRRAAFLYEARRLGYKTTPEVMELVESPERLRDLWLITERTNRAMVDFRQMGRLEREIATRLIFVYPWLRASSKYIGDFVADHPIQASLFVALMYWQQQRLRESFPEGHPGYMKWFFPIKTGDVGEGETPWGFRMDQFLTPLQPLDLAAEIAYWTTPIDLPWGSNEEAFSSKFNPLIEEIFKTVAGWDGFTREEVSHNIIDMFGRMISPEERWASWTRLQKVLNQQTHVGIYDTNQRQNWMRFWLGSIAPVNMNPEEAAQAVEKRKTISVPDKTPEETADDYMAEVEEVNGGPLPPKDHEAIMAWKKNDLVHGRVESKYKRDNDIEIPLSIQQKAAVLLLTIAELNPEKAEVAKQRADMALSASDEEAEAAYEELREALGLSRLGTLNYRISKAQLEQAEAAK